MRVSPVAWRCNPLKETLGFAADTAAHTQSHT